MPCLLSDCVKGYYKRAKAHAAVWNEKEARRDFNMVATLDVTLASLVGRELRAFSERMKEKYWEEKEVYWNMLEKKEDRDHAVEEEEERVGGGPQTREARVEEEEKEERVKASEGPVVELLPSASSSDEEPRLGDVSQGASSVTEGRNWQQMLQEVMLLQKHGNALMKDKRFQDAEEKFKEALDFMDTLQNMVSVSKASITQAVSSAMLMENRLMVNCLQWLAKLFTPRKLSTFCHITHHVQKCI